MNNHIRIRLEGKSHDILEAETEIGKVFKILERSTFYQNGSSQTGRLYLTVEARSGPPRPPAAPGHDY